MSVKGRVSPDGRPPPPYDGDSADEASVCSVDSGISMSYELGPNDQPESSYPDELTWNQGRPVSVNGPFGAVPYGQEINTQLFPQHVPISYPPPAYYQIRPSQLAPEPDESENELDQPPNDDPQVKAEDQNYISVANVILKENRELRWADIQLQSEIRTGLKSQRVMLSQSSSAVQKQLRQAQKYCEAIDKKLKIVESRNHDRHISEQGRIDELRSLVTTVMKDQMMIRSCLERKGMVQIT
ncbi:hypothetical protein FAGAP_6809 [Fusarium agapanthi]|uniref:Uncharacterized protein n=1 Tax=Fusarium agapanthi TaxID=1803897 RepID=A0A9P5BAD3_9HYPO|nr:hypothetical protein FAGAP_6809 [Fusarium agapanthi]